jgi:glycosyltransferase involved in cell wall biosynthesis
VKDEENCVEHMLQSVYQWVSEIVVLDTGSTDRTLHICRDYGARIYQVGFTDFGKIRTVAAHLARDPWVLMLDADETLQGPELLANLARSGESKAYAFPRKRWGDLEMTDQRELEAYPDWQVRFFRNKPEYIWKRELHEYFSGTGIHHVDHGPVIHHFQDVFKDKERKRQRYEQYKVLAKKAGVHIQGGKPLEENLPVDNA